MTTLRLSPDDAAIPAPRTAIVITVTMIACYVALTLNSLSSTHTPHAWWYCVPLAMLALVQIRHLFGSFRGGRPRYWVATVCLQVLLTYPPVLLVGESWVAMPAFLGATLLLFIRSRLRWAVLAVVMAGNAGIERASGDDITVCVYYAVGALTATLSLHGLSRLADLVVQLRDARAELVRLAVARERERV